MAALFGRSLSVVAFALFVAGSEAGFAAPYLAAPVAPVAPVVPYTAVAAAPVLPVAQGVVRSAYSQLVGRSYAPTFVPVATSLAYAAAPVAAPVAVKAVPTVYAAPQQLVAGPVLKTVRPYAVEAPLAYAAPAVAPAFAPSVLSARLAPVPAVGVAAPGLAPTLAPAPAASPLPGVFDARSASMPAPTAQTPLQRAFVTAFGSTQGIRLVGGANTAFEGGATNVEISRAAPAGQDGAAAGGRSATPAASTPETFGVPQQNVPFSEYGLPAPANTPVNP